MTGHPRTVSIAAPMTAGPPEPLPEGDTKTTRTGPAPGSEEEITQYLRGIGFDLGRACVIARALLRLLAGRC